MLKKQGGGINVSQLNIETTKNKEKKALENLSLSVPFSFQILHNEIYVNNTSMRLYLIDNVTLYHMFCRLIQLISDNCLWKSILLKSFCGWVVLSLDVHTKVADSNPICCLSVAFYLHCPSLPRYYHGYPGCQLHCGWISMHVLVTSDWLECSLGSGECAESNDVSSLVS